MIRPRWEWTFARDDDGSPDEAPSPVFTTQYDAEQWLGEHWRGLAAAGVVSARLVNDGRQVTPTVELRAP